MVGIQSAAAEIRLGIKKEEDRRKKPQGKNIMSASATQGGHKNQSSGCYVYDVNVGQLQIWSVAVYTRALNQLKLKRYSVHIRSKITEQLGFALYVSFT